MKPVALTKFHVSHCSNRSRLWFSGFLVVGLSAWNWAGGAESDPGPKAAGPRTGGTLPPAEQKSFFKPDATTDLLTGIPDKLAGPQAGGPVAPGQERLLNKSASLKSLDAAVGVVEKVPANPATGQVSPAEQRFLDKSASAKSEALSSGLKMLPAGPVSGPVSPLEVRLIDKSAAVSAMSLGAEKTAGGPVSSGVLSPKETKTYDKSSLAATKLSIAPTATLVSGPVSGQATAEELKDYKKPGDWGGTASLLVLPLPPSAPGAEKVAAGIIAGQASAEELRGYVKPAALLAPDGSQPARGPASGTLPPGEQRNFQK